MTNPFKRWFLYQITSNDVGEGSPIMLCSGLSEVSVVERGRPELNELPT